MQKIEQVATDKKRFLKLLLLADEQESMIDRYLDRGDCSSDIPTTACLRVWLW